MKRLLATLVTGMLIGILMCSEIWTQTPVQIRNQYPPTFQITKDGTAVLVDDYASMPLSRWSFDTKNPPPNDFEGLPYQLARVNVLLSEPRNAPESATRFFVIDQNAVLYTLDKASKKLTPYIDFSKGFPNFANASPHGGFGTGLGSIVFDPEYAKNGKYYTAHTEKPGMSNPAVPIELRIPGLKAAGFTTTPSINPPAGPLGFESVLVEWTDSNIR